MAKKASGLAAFTRPKITAESVADWQRLRQLADAEGTTIQAMAEAGFSAVLAGHGLPPIEPYLR